MLFCGSAIEVVGSQGKRKILQAAEQMTDGFLDLLIGRVLRAFECFLRCHAGAGEFFFSARALFEIIVSEIGNERFEFSSVMPVSAANTAGAALNRKVPLHRNN